MQVIVDVLSALGSGLVSVFTWFNNFLADLVYLVELLGHMLANIPFYFGWMPPGLTGIIITIFTIVVLYKLLGREG